jgi:hypothetical protein
VSDVGCSASMLTEVTSSIWYTCSDPVSMCLGSAVSDASLQIDLPDFVVCDPQWTTSIELEINNAPCTPLVGSAFGFVRTAAELRINGSSVWDGQAFTAGNVTTTADFTSQGGGMYTASVPGATITADSDVSIMVASVADRTFDANGDTRFNEADADAVAAWVGNSNPPQHILDIADFNGDGVIDVSELNQLNDLLDLGLGAGTFGDANGNGVAGCSDLAMADAAWGLSFGQSGYLVAMDKNLDGDLTTSDRVAFYRLIDRADFNMDGFKDFFDFDDFTAAFEGDDPSADWNGDGFVDFFDYDDFVGDFENGC